MSPLRLALGGNGGFEFRRPPGLPASSAFCGSAGSSDDARLWPRTLFCGEHIFWRLNGFPIESESEGGVGGKNVLNVVGVLGAFVRPTT